MRICFRAFSGSIEITFAASRLWLERDCDPKHIAASRKRFKSLFSPVAAGLLALLASVGTVHAQASLHQPFLDEYKAYTGSEDPLNESRMEVALSYNQRLWAAFNYFKDHMKSMDYDADGQAFVDFFNSDGDIRDSSLIGEFAWEHWGQWGISARYCDDFLLVYYRPDVKFKASLTAQDIHMAPWVRAANRNTTRRATDKFIDVFSLPILDWIIVDQIERQRSENVDIPACIRDDFFDRGPEWTVGLYDHFKLDNFPFKQHQRYEYQNAACDAGDIGEHKRQRRLLTRWKSPLGGWTEDWQEGEWETIADCHPPRVMKTFYHDQCFASQIGYSGEMVPRVWVQHLVEVPDPAAPDGTNWVLSDPDGNINPTMTPELFYSMCDENAPPVIESVEQGPQTSVETIACDDRYARPYRPEVPWTGDIVRTETWNEILQRVPFEELSELRIRENIQVNEVDTCTRQLREDEGNWDYSTQATCRYEGVYNIRRKIFIVYEDRGRTGPHANTSTMSALRTEYGSWEVWQNACYRSVGSSFTQYQNMACGSGYSGYVRERRTVTRVSTRHEQHTSLDRDYDTYDPWNLVDNQCYYDATDTWIEQQNECWRTGTPYMHPNFYYLQQRTVTHSWRIWEDQSKGVQDLGVTRGTWRNIGGWRLFPVDDDQRWDWRQSNCRYPGRIGVVTPSHPSVSPSDNDDGETSYDVDGDGRGDYNTYSEAIEAGHSGTIRAVDGGCGGCRGPRGGNNGSGEDRDDAPGGSGGGSFWDKVKDFFGF